MHAYESVAYLVFYLFSLECHWEFLSLFSYLPLIWQYFLSNLAVWKTQCCRCIPTSAIWSSQATFVHLAPTHWSFCSRVTCLICCPLAVQWSYGISEVFWKSSRWQSFRVGTSGCTHASTAFRNVIIPHIWDVFTGCYQVLPQKASSYFYPDVWFSLWYLLFPIHLSVVIWNCC